MPATHKGKTQKLLEEDSVVDLGFQVRIGVHLELLLEQKAFHEDQRWPDLVAFAAIADGISSHEQILEMGSIHYGVDLFHPCDGSVTFHRGEKRNIDECQVGFHFFEAHKSSLMINLAEIWHKN